MARETPNAMPRSIKLLLVGSVALNVAFVGLFAGMIGTGRMGDGPPRGFEVAIGPVTEALTREDRRAIGEALRARFPDLTRGDRAAAYDRMVEALLQEPFDRAAVEALFDQESARMAGVRAVAQTAFLDRLATMSADDRVAFVNRLKERRR